MASYIASKQPNCKELSIKTVAIHFTCRFTNIRSYLGHCQPKLNHDIKNLALMMALIAIKGNSINI